MPGGSSGRDPVSSVVPMATEDGAALSVCLRLEADVTAELKAGHPRSP